MNSEKPNTNNSKLSAISSHSHNHSKLEKNAFRILLGIVVLAPLAFWPTVSISQDFVKNFVIIIGTIISASLLMLAMRKNEGLFLPPKRLTFITGLLLISLIVSVFMGQNIDKSFFGQGFETGTASLILTMFLVAWVSYILVAHRIQRAALINIGIVGSFLVAVLFQLVRFWPATNGLSLSSLIRSNMIIVNGSWGSMGLFALLVALISLIAVLLLPLSKKMKYLYGIVGLGGLVAAIFIGNMYAWASLAIILAFLIYHNFSKDILQKAAENKNKTTVVLMVIVLLSISLAWKGNVYLAPYINKINPGYVEIGFPWKYTSQIAIDALKDKTLFGFGPNHFVRAFIDYKPKELNLTPVWNAEFTNGFSNISTYFITQGLVGGFLWLMFILLFVLTSRKVLTNLPEDSYNKFVLVSSFSGALFLWLAMLLSTPSHSLILYTFVLTGTALGAAVYCGVLKPFKLENKDSSVSVNIAKYSSVGLIALFAVFAVFYVRQSLAVINFAIGLAHLSTENNPDAALVSFERASKIDTSDIFWRAEVEAMLAKVSQVVQSPDSANQKPEDKTILITGMINDSLTVARKAIVYDSSNYYNYISEARVFEIATKLNMNGAIDAAIDSYKKAINANPHNPELYLLLSRFQASVNKLDDALVSAGAAIQEKQNYLEAVYLISQIQASKGNMKDAIVAAKVTTQINPENPLLWFQLGILNYSDKQYTVATESFNKALSLAPDYANAQYFLGLSYANLGKNTQAIELFKKLEASNPNNQEVKLILENLQSGRKPLTNSNSSMLVSPENRTSLPIKENK